MPSALLMGPKLPCTDGMILAGTLHLLNHAGVTPTEYLTISEERGEQQFPVIAPLYIIVVGTPWVWDRCWKSAKYENLQKVFDKYPNAHKIFLGVGSFLPLGKEEAIKHNLILNRHELCNSPIIPVA